MASGWTPISPWRLGTVQKIAIGAASASATAVGAQTRAVLIVATSDCHIRYGNGTQTAVATDTLIKAAHPPVVLAVSPSDVIAVIQDAAAGSLYITELTH